MPLIGKNEEGAYYIAITGTNGIRYWIPDEAGQRYMYSQAFRNGKSLTVQEFKELQRLFDLRQVFQLPLITLPKDLVKLDSSHKIPGTSVVGIPVEQYNRSIGQTPRASCPAPQPSRRDELSQKLPQMYKWQIQACRAWEAAGKIGIVEAATGTGKTRLAMEAIVDCCAGRGRVLILVPKIALLDQWIAELKRSFSPFLRIGRFDGANHDSFLGSDVR